ncbi:response regulator [Desulfobacula phenolica]|uniref:Response regulator receiver domain-containing protein n=1 Tax=Desulfobacula phenolica TaxID=90732 RepID=A0A1H2FM54_9BACT|nr:response regulator [Desulfobacula phenolica]SDU08424.1 Response regulator receiver domain-containing protein [Desulfobacula phenolica]
MDKQNRILIVDDEKINIKLLTNFLQDEYKIMAARTGKQALKAVRGPNPPDLILLDIILPEMDGYEICTAIKKDEKNRHIPIIFVTAVSEVMDEAKAFDLGAVDYITKPFNPITVKARVNTHIQLSTTMRDLKAALAKVKKLSGLLPICAKCKKIRDDQGYWNEVDLYLEKNSSAKFSHGICPNCSDELYGNHDWYQKRKKNNDLP